MIFWGAEFATDKYQLIGSVFTDILNHVYNVEASHNHIFQKMSLLQISRKNIIRVHNYVKVIKLQNYNIIVKHLANTMLAKQC